MKLPRWVGPFVGAIVVAAAVADCSRSAQTHFERGNAQLEKGNADVAALEYRATRV